MPGRLTTNTLKSQSPSPSLYHILLTIAHITHDPTSEIQRVRVCGTYVSLERATAEAHRVLFEAGYEQEWFTTFDAAHASSDRTPPTTTPASSKTWPHAANVIVYAVAPAGETFTVSIDSTPNTQKWTASADDNSSGRIEISPLFHVLMTTIFYDRDESGETRETVVVGSSESYKEARGMAGNVLQEDVEEDKEVVGKKQKGGRWAEYDVLPLGERDWEFGENVVVHAVGEAGENVLVSVVEAVESNTVRMEAAMRIR